jgi:hypothetical protein
MWQYVGHSSTPHSVHGRAVGNGREGTVYQFGLAGQSAGAPGIPASESNIR